MLKARGNENHSPWESFMYVLRKYAGMLRFLKSIRKSVRCLTEIKYFV